MKWFIKIALTLTVELLVKLKPKQNYFISEAKLC
jgi:hypothetical protein